jgi:hypothetical protein
VFKERSARNGTQKAQNPARNGEWPVVWRETAPHRWQPGNKRGCFGVAEGGNHQGRQHKPARCGVFTGLCRIVV